MANTKRGRPKIDIDLKTLTALCRVGCKNREIAAVFNVTERTIESRRREPDFKAAMDRGEALGCVSLRRRQHELAMKGDKTMLVWLGKQRLEQKDRIKNEFEGSLDLPTPVIHVNFVKPKPSSDEA